MVEDRQMEPSSSPTTMSRQNSMEAVQPRDMDDEAGPRRFDFAVPNFDVSPKPSFDLVSEESLQMDHMRRSASRKGTETTIVAEPSSEGALVCVKCHDSMRERDIKRAKAKAKAAKKSKAKKQDDKKEEEKEEVNPPSKRKGQATVGDFSKFATSVTTALNILGIIAACIAGAMQPLMTIVFGNLTNSFVKFQHAKSSGDLTIITIARDQLHSEIRTDLLYLVYLGIAIFVLTYVYQSIWIYSGDIITRRIRESYLASVLRQETAFFDNVGAGEVASRLETDTQLIQDGISDKVPMAFMQISTFVAGIIVAYIRCWKLTLVVSSVIPCMLLSGMILNILIAKLQAQEVELVSRAANIAHEALAAIRTVKAFGIENKLVEQYDVPNRQATLAGFARAKISAMGMGVFFFAIYCGYALAFFFGTKLVADGEIQGGIVISVVFSILIGTISIALLAPNLSAMGYAASAAATIFDTIDRESTIIKPKEDAAVQVTVGEGKVEFKDVSFTYASRSDATVLQDCSLVCEPRQVTALVGASGSGKSTVISLLERFYDPTDGEIFLDSIPITELGIPWLRANIGLVSQEPTLFAVSVRQNIEYGLLALSNYANLSESEKQEKIVEAAKSANADGFIRRLPQGYDTLVGDGGGLLSGGQKQRIAIARAIVKDPRILLLDEATSALDPRSESVVLEALKRVSKGRTTIHVAHRLSTIKEAEKIIVMGRDNTANGAKVLEQGKHRDLITRNGVYATLVNAQEVLVKEQQDDIEVLDDEVWEEMDLKNHSSASSSYSNDHFGTSSPQSTAIMSLYSAPEKTMDSDRNDSNMDIESQQSFHVTPDVCASPEEYNEGEKQLGQSPSRTKKESVKKKEKKEGKPPHESIYYLLYRLMQLDSRRMASLFLPGLLGAVAFGAVYPCLSILLGLSLGNFSQCQQAHGTNCAEPFNSAMRHRGNWLALWFFVIALLCTLAIFFQSLCLIRNSMSLMRSLRRASIHKMLHSDTAFFDDDNNRSGALSNSLAANAAQLNGLLGATAGSIVQAISTLVCGAVIALAFGWKLSLVVLACVPLTMSAGLIRFRLVIRKDAQLRVAHRQSAQRACEAVNAIRTVASLNLEDKVLEIYHENLQAPSRMVQRTAVYGNLLFAFSQAVSFWVTALGFWYGARLLSDGDYTSQQFFTIFTSVVFGSVQAGNVFNYTPDISSAKQAAQDSLKLLDSKPLLEEPVPYLDAKAVAAREASAQEGNRENKSEEKEVDARGHLRFSNVCFHYPTRPDVKVLRGMDLTVEPGTSAALVGPSGSGKSTVVQLIERLYHPTQGAVFLDGRNIRDMHPRELRRNMAIVSQEPVLFEGTIAFNILAGLSDIESNATAAEEDEKMRRAAADANALDFIESLPDKFDTNVGRAGTQLSGGQKQRIALARALIRDPKILLLDEATSALDATSEKVVQEALVRASKGRTTISIAHRIASIVHSDKIVCLQDGRVVESGTHDTLMARQGSYSELVAMQALD